MKRLLLSIILLFLSVAVAGVSASARAQGRQQNGRVTGVVRDQAGAPIAGATVTLTANSSPSTQSTGSDGRFAFSSVASESGTITARANGFETHEHKWSLNGTSASDLEIVLAPAAISERMTVTATRTESRLSDVAASAVVFTSEDLAATSALTLDDALRQVPGFSLFRRSGSRTANPTSQGVSLRGVGASGASRALVLADGIPLNDPFGGWVYWGRVPREAIGQVEVVRGGASSLYGTDALGGVINFIPRREQTSSVSFETSYGNEKTPSASLVASGWAGKWGLHLGAQVLNTDGYILVDEADRGRVDTAAGVEYSTIDLSLDRRMEQGGLFVRGSLFGESRENGTPLQTNRTHIRQLAAGGDWQNRIVGAVQIRIYGGAQVYDQDFSAIAADRNSEALTRSQRVPAQQFGLALQWSRQAGTRQTLVAGLDGREVRGASDELVFAAGRLTSAVGAGGRERSFGVYGQDIIRVTSKLIATLGGRVDHWRNYDALSTTRPLAQPGPAVVTRFNERTETAFSPRLSLLQRLNENFSLVGSAYRAFRAPSLNELYRAFRVGNVLTLANNKLEAERLTGGEAGASYSGLDRRLNARGVYFFSEITRPIANVTLSSTPQLITRQRQNLGRTRSQGVDFDASAQIRRNLIVSGGYQFVDATVLSFPANRALEGLLIPQVPRHQLTFQARYADPSHFMVSFQGRMIGAQFEDDQNQLRLDRFFTLDALASKPVSRNVELFTAFENLFNQQYAVGRTPVETLGPPLLARFGVRLHFGSR